MRRPRPRNRARVPEANGTMQRPAARDGKNYR